VYVECVKLHMVVRELESLRPLAYNIRMALRPMSPIRLHGLVFKPLKPHCNGMHHVLSNNQFCILPTECIYGFLMVLTANSDHFLEQH
jgi:hypothetical protein